METVRPRGGWACQRSWACEAGARWWSQCGSSMLCKTHAMRVGAVALAVQCAVLAVDTEPPPDLLPTAVPTSPAAPVQHIRQLHRPAHPFQFIAKLTFFHFKLLLPQKKVRVKSKDGAKGGKPTFHMKSEPCESFFNFFDPPQVGKQ